jgi:hypothetical protein
MSVESESCDRRLELFNVVFNVKNRSFSPVHLCHCCRRVAMVTEMLFSSIKVTDVPIVPIKGLSQHRLLCGFSVTRGKSLLMTLDRYAQNYSTTKNQLNNQQCC